MTEMERPAQIIQRERSRTKILHPGFYGQSTTGKSYLQRCEEAMQSSKVKNAQASYHVLFSIYNLFDSSVL